MGAGTANQEERRLVCLVWTAGWLARLPSQAWQPPPAAWLQLLALAGIDTGFAPEAAGGRRDGGYQGTLVWAAADGYLHQSASPPHRYRPTPFGRKLLAAWPNLARGCQLASEYLQQHLPLANQQRFEAYLELGSALRLAGDPAMPPAPTEPGLQAVRAANLEQLVNHARQLLATEFDRRDRGLRELGWAAGQLPRDTVRAA